MNGLSLIGAVLVGLGIPLGWEGFDSGNIVLIALSVPMVLLGLVSLGIDYFNKEEWIKKYILGIDE